MLFKCIFIGLLFCTSLHAKEYIFATYPSNNPAKIMHAFAPLMEYLSANTNNTFKLVVTKDYDELFSRIEEKSVDFAWVNTKSFVLLKEKKSLSTLPCDLFGTLQKWADYAVLSVLYRHSEKFTCKRT